EQSTVRLAGRDNNLFGPTTGAAFVGIASVDSILSTESSTARVNIRFEDPAAIGDTQGEWVGIAASSSDLDLEVAIDLPNPSPSNNDTITGVGVSGASTARLAGSISIKGGSDATGVLCDGNECELHNLRINVQDVAGWAYGVRVTRGTIELADSDIFIDDEGKVSPCTPGEQCICLLLVHGAQPQARMPRPDP